MKLYTYVPKDADKSIRSIATLPKDNLSWTKYKERANAETRDEVLDWLESTAPGRTRSFSAFTQPIPDDANPDILAFRDAKRLAVVDYDQLKRDGLIDAVYATNPEWEPDSDVPKLIAVEPTEDDIDWQQKVRRDLLFAKIRHYLIALKKGYVPARYVSTK